MNIAVIFAAAVSLGEMTLPTYMFSDPDPVPGPSSERYPYFRFDSYESKSSPRTWRTVTLENDRLQVVITPEVGGKIWGAIDKETGVDFIYFNHVAKFRDVSMRGPWSSGGIEFNFGRMGHEPYTTSPVDWCVRTNADRSVSCFVGGTEWLCRTWWQIEINLRDGDRFFTTRATWFNGSGLVQPYYQWMNAAFHGGGETKYEFPGRNWLGHEGDAHPWPQDSGHDISVYSQNDISGYREDHRSMHIINGDTRYFGVWWPHLKAGAAHECFTEEKYGRKIWMWALSRQGQIWEKLLTDSDGPYVELQSGRGFQQPHGKCWATPFKHPSFAPCATEAFTEKWSAVGDPSYFGKFTERGEFEPRPVKMPKDFDWNGVYGLYLRGSQLLRQGRGVDLAPAERFLREALGKDACFVPALDALASLCLSEARYAEAKELSTKALAINTYDAEANYVDGLLLLHEGKWATALDRLGLAAYDLTFRSAALAFSARINLGRGEWAEAIRLAEKALEANARNFDALAVISAAKRHQGAADAGELALKTLEAAPLNHLFRYELSKLGRDDASRFVLNEFPEKTWTELAGWYETSGLFEEALELYAKAPNSVVARVRSAFLLARLGRVTAARDALSAAEGLPLGFDFPFRQESFDALEWAVAHSRSWRFRYLLALLSANKGRGREGDALLEACGDEMDEVAPLLYRAGRFGGERSLRDLAKAAKLGDSWRVGLGFYRAYAAAERWADARRSLEDYVKRYPGRLGLQLNYARTLLKTGDWERAVSFLETIDTLPSELGEKPISIYQEALGLMAEQALKNGDETAAKAYVEKALSTPETLGTGRQFKDDRVIDSFPAAVRTWLRK